MRSFFELWGGDEFLVSHERYLADDVRWLNSGLPECVGKLACLALAEKVAERYPIVKVEIRSLAVNGDAVLVERIDRLMPSDGSAPLEVEMAGSFRLRAGKIYYWYDYYDPRSLVASSES